MVSLDVNRVLQTLDIKYENKFVLIREYDLADSNFILSYLMKDILRDPKNKIFLLLMHNTIGHYINVAKKLRYNLAEKINSKNVLTLEPMTHMYNHIIGNDVEFPNFQNTILNSIKELKSNQEGGQTYYIIDNLSQLFDLGFSSSTIIKFVNEIADNLFIKNINMIVNIHIGDDNDRLISDVLDYNADLKIAIEPLKTGRNSNVTGMITVNNGEIYHYKALENMIKIFKPGDYLHNLSE